MSPRKYTWSNGSKMDDFENFDKVNVSLYQEMLGCLGYLVAATRPDLAYTYSKLSQYSRDPRTIHLQGIKRALRYLKGTKHVKLKISEEQGVLNVYSDASWCVTKDSKSFAGYTMMLGKSLIGWKCKKEKMVALSTMESELIGICEAICEEKWVVSLIEDIGFQKLVRRPVQIFTDNKSITDWTNDFKMTARNKHVMRKSNFVKEDIENGEIIIKHHRSYDMTADILTKDVDKNTLSRHMLSLGMLI